MKQYETSKIKNFCLLGHGNSGKTSLAEAMLYTAETLTEWEKRRKEQRSWILTLRR